MKTENGAPKFEMNELLSMTVTANEQLRAWAAARKCVGCAYFDDLGDDFYYCREALREYLNDFDPTTFSCAAFEGKL